MPSTREGDHKGRPYNGHTMARKTPFDPQRHHRRSVRLKGYDYTQSGAYFVTICAQHRECLFGEIQHGEMVLNDAGRMVQAEWERLPQRFPLVMLDACVVMPNHIHGIIILHTPERSIPNPADGATTSGATTRVAPTDRDADTGICRPALGDIVGAFKSITTNVYIQGVREGGWPPFDRRVWQRNYHERVIRNERELDAISQYIVHNPARWDDDIENPNQRR